MGYVDKNLNDGEEVIYQAKVSWAVYFRIILLLGLLIWISTKTHWFVVFLMVIASLFIIFRIFLAIVSTEFALTNRRIIAKRGIIKRHTMEMLLEKVESIKISQPLDGRIINFGTVTIIGSGGSREDFHSISNPNELQKQVNYIKLLDFKLEFINFLVYKIDLLM